MSDFNNRLRKFKEFQGHNYAWRLERGERGFRPHIHIVADWDLEISDPDQKLTIHTPVTKKELKNDRSPAAIISYVWGRGRIDCRPSYGDTNDIISYMCKYMGKVNKRAELDDTVPPELIAKWESLDQRQFGKKLFSLCGAGWVAQPRSAFAIVDECNPFPTQCEIVNNLPVDKPTLPPHLKNAYERSQNNESNPRSNLEDALYEIAVQGKIDEKCASLSERFNIPHMTLQEYQLWRKTHPPNFSDPRFWFRDQTMTFEKYLNSQFVKKVYSACERSQQRELFKKLTNARIEFDPRDKNSISQAKIELDYMLKSQSLRVFLLPPPFFISCRIMSKKELSERSFVMR